MAISVSVAGRNAGLDGLSAHIDAGAAVSKIRFYSGTIPTDVETALSGNTLLVTADLNATAFGAAASATITANAIAQTSVSLSGTVTFFRIEDGDGVAVVQGSAGSVGGEDCTLDNAEVVSGGDFNVTSLTISQAGS